MSKFQFFVFAVIISGVLSPTIVTLADIRFEIAWPASVAACYAVLVLFKLAAIAFEIVRGWVVAGDESNDGQHFI